MFEYRFRYCEHNRPKDSRNLYGHGTEIWNRRMNEWMNEMVVSIIVYVCYIVIGWLKGWIIGIVNVFNSMELYSKDFVIEIILNELFLDAFTQQYAINFKPYNVQRIYNFTNFVFINKQLFCYLMRTNQPWQPAVTTFDIFSCSFFLDLRHKTH